MITLIAACDLNRVIGKEGKTPWHIPEELKFFKTMTVGKTCVFGRKTAESIGKALPDRECWILSREKEPYQNPANLKKVTTDGWLFTDMQPSKYGAFTREIMICGGQQIYELFMPYADRIILSVIQDKYEGDTFFPEIDHDEWEMWSLQSFTESGFNVITYARK